MSTTNRYALNQKLLAAAMTGDVEIFLSLIEEGAELDTRNNDGQNAMHIAAQKGHTDLIVALIGLGATPNTIDNINFTPLHWAANGGHAETVACLLEHGAKLDVQSLAGTSVMDLAQQSDSGHPETPIYEYVSRKHAEKLKRDYAFLHHKCALGR